MKPISKEAHEKNRAIYDDVIDTVSSQLCNASVERVRLWREAKERERIMAVPVAVFDSRAKVKSKGGFWLRLKKLIG